MGILLSNSSFSVSLWMFSHRHAFQPTHTVKNTHSQPSQTKINSYVYLRNDERQCEPRERENWPIVELEGNHSIYLVHWTPFKWTNWYTRIPSTQLYLSNNNRLLIDKFAKFYRSLQSMRMCVFLRRVSSLSRHSWLWTPEKRIVLLGVCVWVF